MNFQSVICRFVPLLDVVLTMLGVLVLVMATARISHDQDMAPLETAAQLESPDEDPRMLQRRSLSTQLLRGLTLVYAETAPGENFDRCFLLDENGRPKKTVPLTTTIHPSDIPELVPGATVVLLISGAGFDSRWTRKRIAAIESTFEIHVVPIYNIELNF